MAIRPTLYTDVTVAETIMPGEGGRECESVRSALRESII